MLGLYSGTSIKRTPLGNSLLIVIERWSSLGGFDCQLYVYSLSHFLLQMNLEALLTASLAHTSFEKAVQLGFHDCAANSGCGLSVLGGYC